MNDASRQDVLRRRAHTAATVVALIPVVMGLVETLVVMPAAVNPADLGDMTRNVFLAIYSSVALAAPLIYIVAMARGVRPASAEDVVRGVLTVLQASMPAQWILLSPFRDSIPLVPWGDSVFWAWFGLGVASVVVRVARSLRAPATAAL